jgi:hypothetical protein
MKHMKNPRNRVFRFKRYAPVTLALQAENLVKVDVP